jgi:phage tail-like protein
MALAIASLAGPSSVDLTVEAGGTVETTLDVGTMVGAAGSYELRLRGLPFGWATLSATRFELNAGQSGRALLVVHPPHGAAPGDQQLSVEVVEREGPVLAIQGRLSVRPPGALVGRSRLVELLPRPFRQDELMGRFLLVFQSVVDPIELRIDSSHHYLDPLLAPAPQIPWLGSWLALGLPADLSLASQRAIVARAIELYRWKGTRRALRAELALRTGARPLIVENFDGLRLGEEAALGINTQIGERHEGSVIVTLVAPRPLDADELRRADELIDELKPVHVGHILRAVDLGPAPNRGI